jgi:hypothetical protein
MDEFKSSQERNKRIEMFFDCQMFEFPKLKMNESEIMTLKLTFHDWPRYANLYESYEILITIL